MTTEATDLQPSCVLLEYHVRKLLVEELRETVVKPSFELFPDVCLQEGDERKYRTVLRCDYLVDRMRFHAVVEGAFEFKSAVGPDNVMHAWVNGGTVLYGILRGLFAEMSAQCSGKVSVLPTVMMVEYVRRRIRRLVGEPEGKSGEKTA